jgi:hypothetical protein
MSYVKWKYRSGQPRGGVPGVNVDTDSSVTGKTRKNYAIQVKQYWGPQCDQVQQDLAKELKNRGLR